ncbi:MAG: EAL domain-containing protein [Acholeplasmatales bacterium]|nr:EAL domain-containing protein [Acholeplasmatales bacterium]
MRLSIPTQLCGLVLSVILLILFLMQRKMNIKREKHFLRCIIATIIVLVLDIVATTFNTFMPDDEFFTVYANRLYLIATNAILLVTILYMAGEVFTLKRYKIIFWSTIAYGIVLSLIVGNPYITTNVVTNQDNGLIIYTEGSATIITYASAAIGILVILVGSFVYKDKLGKKPAIAVRLWMGIWSAFALLQFFRKEMLVVSFAVSLGLLIMYVALEALDSNIDSVTGLFNWNGYLRYVEERKKEEIPCEVFYLKALNSLKILDEKTVSEVLTAFNKVLLKRKDIISFRIQNEYLIILKKNASLDVIIKAYQEYKKNNPIISTNYYPFYIKDTTAIDNQSDLSSLVELASQNANMMQGDYSEIDQKILRDFLNNIKIQSYIEQAIHQEDLVVVYYQPIYDLRKKKFTCAEALVRLKTKEEELIPPGEFISLAEKNGMIHKLDEIVFDKVCKFIHNNNMEELGLEYIESNLSVAQLCDENLHEKYLDIINKNNIDTKYVNLEITESAELEHRGALTKNLDILSQKGVSFSLDDYGTGYSNLNYVVDMPVKIVKFDKVLVDSYFQSYNQNNQLGKRAKISIESSISMFRTLGLEIVCEGVERQEQEDVLEELNINYIQGFLHSKPLPEKAFIEFLKDHNK